MSTSNVEAKARYKKLKNGRWGLRVESATAIKPGTKALVSKRDGTSEVRTVESVLWSGHAEDGSYLAICTQKRTKADEAFLAKRKKASSTGKKADKASDAPAGFVSAEDVAAMVQAAVAAALAGAQAPAKKGRARKRKAS